MANALYSPYSGYILGGATWTGTTPSTNYSLDTFDFIRPDWRVKFPSTSATITATLSGPAKADVVAVPMSNCDDGTSPTILRVTNGSGLDQAVEFPALPPDGIPLTAILDLRGLADASTRTASVWNFIFANNSQNLTLGAALWLGSLVEFAQNYRPNFTIGERRFNGTDANFYGVVNRVRGMTRERYIDFGVPSRDAQRDQLMAWARAGEGSALPSIFWPNPAVNDAFLGSWPDDYSFVTPKSGYAPMDGIRFTEWNKGLALL